jgi:preprotein translocase subunit YajC
MILPALVLLPIAPREGGSATLVFAVQMLAIFAIFYFLLIRPQRAEQDKLRKMLEALKKGDEVITAGGIIGTVLHADADRVTLRTAESTRIVVERARIAKVVTPRIETKSEAP